MKNPFIFHLSLFILLLSCRGPEVVLPPEPEQTGDTVKSEIVGFYLLNEGNMGSNKATLDYYDFASGIYTRNIYAYTNPDVAQSLGDVGNDLQHFVEIVFEQVVCAPGNLVCGRDDGISIVDGCAARKVSHVDKVE